jgi:transposase-like protein
MGTTEKQREAFDAYIRGETTQVAVARRLGISQSALSQRLRAYRRSMGIAQPAPKYRGRKRPARFLQLSALDYAA